MVSCRLALYSGAEKSEYLIIPETATILISLLYIICPVFQILLMVVMLNLIQIQIKKIPATTFHSATGILTALQRMTSRKYLCWRSIIPT